MEEKILTVKVYTVPADRVLFRVLKNGEPVAGAKVERIQQTAVVAGVETPILSPSSDIKTTDEDGEVLYTQRAEMDKDKWAMIAYIPNSSFGFVKSGWVQTHGESYDVKLKEYKKPPTMFVEFKLRDVIGAEAYGTLLGAVEKWNLEHTGFTDVKVLGKGTRTVRVEFTAPFSEESPLIVWLGATRKGVFALILVVVALGIIFISLWKFGEKVIAPVGKGLAWIVIALVALEALKRR